MNIKSVLVAIACLSLFSFAQLPTLTVKTKNNQTPVANQVQNGNNFCPAGTYSQNMMQQNSNASTSGGMGYTLPYIEATETELSGADTKYNFKRTSSGKPNESDSIRRRGNSTASGGGGGMMFPGMGGGGGEKIPFRVKFDKKVAMFGRPAEKSWALLANYYDPSIMQSYLAFYLGRKLGLDFTPNGYYLKLNVAGQNRGVYLLTDQIQRSEASVNIDKEGGWLAEFDYHCATSTADQKRFYHTGANRYNLNTKIREPDLDDLPLNQSRQPDGTCLDFVKSDLNKLLDKMKENNFPNNGYRDYVDLTSYAKYIMIQLFLDNQDFNGLASSSTLLGSNYAYRNKGEKIKAGPLWDFDLACGSSMMGSSFFTNDINEQLEPRHDFYKRLWQDPVFQARYKKIWNDNKSVFERVGTTVIDSITNLVASSMAGNVASGVSNVTEQSYRQHTGKLKDWWSKRINAFSNKVNQLNGSDVAETAVAQDLINSKMNCREAVSSSSKPSSSSANNVASSSSRASSSSANNVASSSSRASSSSVNNNGQATLACNGLQSSVEKGGTIAEPTLSCSNGSQPSNPQWQGRPQQNGSWTTNPQSNTASYTISVTATCGQSYNLTAQCGTVTVGAAPSSSSGLSSSSSEDPTPIVPKHTILSIRAQAVGNAIVLENLPSNTKIELYNLQGNRIYSTNSGNSQTLRIGVQTGMYVMRATLGSEKKVQRIIIK